MTNYEIFQILKRKTLNSCFSTSNRKIISLNRHRESKLDKQSREAMINMVFHKILTMVRSSHQRCSVKKVVLKSKFCKFHWKPPVLESIFNIKKRLQHRCFLMKFVEILETTILKNICKRLLLNGALILKFIYLKHKNNF